MKRSFILIIFLLLGPQLVKAQLFKYGIQAGPHYSHYGISEKGSFIEASRGSIGFHSGFFIRKDFESFFIGADLTYSSYLGGTAEDGYSSFKLETGSVNMPMIFGKYFYPGIRIFGGGMPAFFIKHNDGEFESFLAASPATQSSVNGFLHRNDFIFHIVAGASMEIRKFYIELRYEHPLDYFIREDYSTGGTTTNIDNRHYIYQFVISLGYWFN